MFQQQNAFLAGASGEVDTVAVRALAALAATQNTENPETSPQSMQEKTQHYCELTGRFFEAAISAEQGRIAGVIQEMQQAGIADRDITSAFVPTVARQLGTAWERDVLPFSTVTIGGARLQAIVRQLDKPGLADHVAASDLVQHCLVVVPEGAQHTLGAIVLTSQLRQAGARVKLMLGVCSEMMGQMVHAMPYDAVMISGADAGDLESLRSLVKSSRKRGAMTKVFLGGCILGDRSDLVTATETDYVSNNWQEVLDLCARNCRME